MKKTDGTIRRPRQLGELTDVYDFLEEVRLRPGIWIHSSSLQHLNSMLIGYRVALGIHDIAEPFDFWNPGTQSGFSEWLEQRLGRRSSLGWATEIEREAERLGRPVLEMFFELMDEFRTTNHQLRNELDTSIRIRAEAQQPIASVSDPS